MTRPARMDPPPLAKPQPGDALFGKHYYHVPVDVPALSTLFNDFKPCRVESMTIPDHKDWIIALPEDKLRPSDGSLALAVFATGYYRFTNLCKLHLHGVSPPWKASIFCRLRSLTVWDCPDDAPKMDMHTFVTMAATWNCLQELHFRNVLAVVSGDGSDSESPPAATHRAILPRLQRLTIQDLPERARRALACLKLPVCNYADIVADYRGRDSTVDGRCYFWALRDIAPPAPLALAYLPFSPTWIDVDATDVRVGVVGYAGNDKRVVLRVETEETFPERARAIFFAGAAHYLSKTFSADDRAHVTTLRLRGPLRMVQWTFTWVEIFRAFPRLERFVVRDDGPDGAAATELVKALEATVMFDKTRVVCSRLRHLSLRGVGYSKELLDLFFNVLQRRAGYPRTVKPNLDLEFVLDQGVDAGETCTKVKRRLASVAFRVEVCCRYK
ncbi:hypothetical protein C8T65DRAFT_734262 [Cerioporus squamosus]|nr:hypothetical protein C8T65DRAFT_734262 [Cerioporus squamosus]